MGMKISLNNVNNTFKTLSESARRQSKQHDRGVVALMTSELKMKTPVDTGLAQRSWSVAETPNGFDLTNSTPYIEHLNRGTSKQAPAFFVEETALKYGTPKGAIVETT